MYWTITLLISLGGLVVCWSILSARWQTVSGSRSYDPVRRAMYPRLIQLARTFHPILPGHPGYMDLKFSLLRHALAFFVSAGLLRLLGSRFWETALLGANLLYAGLTVWVYLQRKQELQEIALESTEREQLTVPTRLVRDSFVVVAYSVIAAASLYLLLYLDVPAAPAAPSTLTEPPRATAPAETEPRPSLRQLPKPDHGHIFEDLTARGVAPFSVSGSGDIYLVLDPIDLSASVKSGMGQAEAELIEGYMELRVFIRSGKTFETDVPLGEYEVFYATGDAWYGEDELFGPDTQYYKCDGTFDFTEDSEGYNGWTLTLTAVYNGNLDTDSIPAAVFPK